MVLAMFVLLGIFTVAFTLFCANVRYRLGKTDEGVLPFLGTAGNLMMLGPVSIILLRGMMNEGEPATWLYASCLAVWSAGCTLLLVSHNYAVRPRSP